MLCFIYFLRLILNYVRGFFPIIFEQVEGNMWIDIIRHFTMGHLGLMFIATVMVIFFEVYHAAFQHLIIVTCVGGKIIYNW